MAAAPPPAQPGPRLIRQQQLLAEAPGATPPAAPRRRCTPRAPRNTAPGNLPRVGILATAQGSLQVRT